MKSYREKYTKIEVFTESYRESVKNTYGCLDTVRYIGNENIWLLKEIIFDIEHNKGTYTLKFL